VGKDCNRGLFRISRLTFLVLCDLMPYSMKLGESIKNPLLVACLALGAAAACSEKEDDSSNVAVAGITSKEAAERFVKSSTESSPEPSPGSIDVKDLPVAKWYSGVKYDGCKGLDFRSTEDLKTMHEDCKFYDSNSVSGKGSPVLDLRGHYRKRVSQHFKVRDFARIDPDDLEHVSPLRYETSDGIPVYRYARIDPELVSIMEEIRTAVGFPIVVSGGFRPFSRNVDMYLEYGGRVKRKSQHVSGRAVDTELNLTFNALMAQCESSPTLKACGLGNKDEMAERLFKKAHGIMEKRGGGGIGVGNNQMHFDARGGGRVATWGYDAWNRRRIDRWTRER